MAEAAHPQHGHEVVAGGELGVGAKVVRGLPEVGFDFLDAFEGLVGHAEAMFSLIFNLRRLGTPSSQLPGVRLGATRAAGPL